ncbi:MAG: flavodoxin family protein [Bacteroidetes bacterium]|nr:flavodoxin family protein [Bacteroidota bacterium]
MKTLVFFGSARKHGETKAMLDILLESMSDKAGDVEIIDCYNTDVKPCIDCRYCWEHRGCSIKDTMQDIYQKIDAADNIIIASPVYYHSVPGKVKMLIDRLQIYWAGIPRGDKPKTNCKKGVGLLTGGAPSFPNQFLGSELVLEGVFTALSADNLGIVTFSNTDKMKVSESEEIRILIKELAIMFPDM